MYGGTQWLPALIDEYGKTVRPAQWGGNPPKHHFLNIHEHPAKGRQHMLSIFPQPPVLLCLENSAGPCFHLPRVWGSASFAEM
jgi:hypothetical protein